MVEHRQLILNPWYLFIALNAFLKSRYQPGLPGTQGPRNFIWNKGASYVHSQIARLTLGFGGQVDLGGRGS